MSIAGTWYNELGSQMDIEVDGKTIRGKYWTAVGNASGQYDLVGLIDPTSPSPGGQAVGWTVVWTNDTGTSNSVTTWCGQYQSDNGVDEIITFWLLGAEQISANDWGATKIGNNRFIRTLPTPESILKFRKTNATSHPITKG